MGKIKSALEIAMGRIEDIKGDKSVFENYKFRQEGKKIASQILDKKGVDLKEKIKEYGGRQAIAVKEGLFEVLYANLFLPKSEIYEKELEILKKGFVILTNNKKRVEFIFGEIDRLFTQYLENMKSLKEHIDTQYAQVLRQKEAELSKKAGYEVHLSPEQDPEYLKLLQNNTSRLKEQYQDALNKMKGEIQLIFKKENT